ncbi:MAG: TipAS antibiotic-recognition domain-containing protein, partial [Longimicrobiales bacterium]
MSDHTKQRHADEARERWGHTDAYRQSAARTTSYSESVWAEIKA